MLGGHVFIGLYLEDSGNILVHIDQLLKFDSTYIAKT